MFYHIEGHSVLMKGGQPQGESVVFENQLATAIVLLLGQADVKSVVVKEASEYEFMQYQKRKRRKEKDGR